MNQMISGVTDSICDHATGVVWNYVEFLAASGWYSCLLRTVPVGIHLWHSSGSCWRLLRVVMQGSLRSPSPCAIAHQTTHLWGYLAIFLFICLPMSPMNPYDLLISIICVHGSTQTRYLSNTGKYPAIWCYPRLFWCYAFVNFDTSICLSHLIYHNLSNPNPNRSISTYLYLSTCAFTPNQTYIAPNVKAQGFQQPEKNGTVTTTVDRGLLP